VNSGAKSNNVLIIVQTGAKMVTMACNGLFHGSWFKA